MPDDDRDALSWEGDADDETLVTRAPETDAGAATAAAPAARATQTVAAAGPSGGRRFVEAFTLILALGAAAGWVAVMLANPAQQQTLLGLAMYQLGELLAVLAPVGWWLAARSLAARPVPWWIAGVVVTAPWPLIVGVLA